MKNYFTSLAMAIALTTTLVSGLVNAAKPAEVNVAYFLGWPTPNQFAHLKNTYDSVLGTKVNWLPFANGHQMSKAMAVGEVDIAYSQGHMPFVIGVTRGLELTMVGVAVGYSENDNCIVRSDSGISKANAKALEGKSVATLTGNVTHYRLLKVLAHLGVDHSKVNIKPMKGEAAASALQSGEVVMACAFGSALQSMVSLGKPLMTSAEQEALGLKVFDVVSVATPFMNKNPEIVQAFMDVTEAANEQWHKNPDPMRTTIARAADMDRAGSNKALARFTFPAATDQKSIAWMGAMVADYSKDLADFFVEQRQLSKALDSYERFISTQFLR